MSDGKRRVTLLSGAAVFDVTSDANRPFVVETEDSTAKVLGTVFDVRNSAGVVRLSVAEGEVEVAHPITFYGISIGIKNRRSVTAGEHITADRIAGLSQAKTFNPDDFAIWRKGRLRYQNATLAEVIEDANRYSARKIVLSDALKTYSDDRATMIFDGRDIARLLRSLPKLFPVSVKENGAGHILITARQPKS